MDKQKRRSLSKGKLEALLEEYEDLCMRRATLSVETAQAETRLLEVKKNIAELYEELGE